MKARTCGGLHSHFDGVTTIRRYRRRFGLSSQDEKLTNSQVFREYFPSCKNETCVCGSSLKRTEKRRDGYRLRRPSFEKAHLRTSVCAMEHFLPKFMSNGQRKRTLESREHCYVMEEKKLRPSKLNCNMASIKSTRSKEMVSHKYRTVDSLQRNGVSHAEKQKDMQISEVKGKKSNRICRKDVMTLSETKFGKRNPSMLTVKKDGSSSHGVLLEDWTQEYLLEPRRKDKRKSLDELQAAVDSPPVVWRKESNTKIRRVEIFSNEALGKAGEPELSQLKIGPADEVQRSLCGSEGGGLNDSSDVYGKEKIFAKSPSDNQNVSVGNVCTSPSMGQFSRQQTNSLPGAFHDKCYPGQAFCNPMTVKDSKSSLDDGLPYENSMNGVKELTIHPMLMCKHFDQSRPVELYPDDELSKAVIADSRQVETLLVLKQKEFAEELCTYDKFDDTAQVELRLKALEGKKCGLCGGDSRGEPAKYLIPDSSEMRDHYSKPDETFTGYSEWDAFGSEPGWLGPLLGPLGDRFSIAGVWVHQECAIWSPEVYFAGVGRVKNIRAALRRGKMLKCSRCTRPGATIGCRIGRCPRTYHLPCARYEGCYFDHKKFLMACDEHLHHFLPRLPGGRSRRRSLNMERIRFKRKITEWKKTAQRTAQLDAETEEKWQEKAGVDEEFLRREWRRLQRDIARVAPVMVGGGNEEGKVEGWELIAGSDNVIQCMKEMVMLPLLYPDVFAQLGVSPPRGVLLHGHPGTGKTLAVRALVGACAKGPKQIAYFSRKGADCLGKYAGDAERQLRILFNLAEKHQPSIIFFDEIDGLAPTRSQHQDQTQKSVVSTLLALMDGIKSRGSVVVIGATNRPDALDPALRRPGRFDREIYFPLPSLLDRTAILTLLTKDWQIPLKHEVISLLASRTTGFAGADLQALCAQAAIYSLRRIVSVDDLMSLVEKQGNIPSFPNIKVTAVDWATALGQVSPPCSWRSAKAGLNTVICAPVPHHIIPVLLWPMVELLMSLYLNNQVVLPPVLNKLASMLEKTLLAYLGDSGIDHIKIFLHNCGASSIRLELEQALENIFVVVGMVSDGKVRPATSIVPNVAYEGSKFCVMLAGKERAWLDHFAAWFLFGFEGFNEMCNLNLTTMLQEGGGDVIHGLIHILGNIQNKSPCVIYMPQLESWAVESVPKDQAQAQAETSRKASHCWNIFLQQVYQLPSKLQIIFVASSQMRKDELPEDVLNFFWTSSVSMPSSNMNSSGGSQVQESQKSFSRSSPCLWVEAFLGHNMAKVFRRAAAVFAGLLCQELLCHLHPENKKDPSNSIQTISVADATEPSSPSKSFTTSHTVNEADPGFPMTDNHAPETKPTSVCPPGHSILRVAISMIGYELLYHPELKDLRHATSKLQEGPCYATKTCMAALPEPVTNSSGEGDRAGRSIKGLKAVGLLAYKGNYLKARDVAGGVDEVMALLMKQISIKISLGKDHSKFLHIFNKAASLQDKISVWAHNLRRFDFGSGRPQGNTPELSVSKSTECKENVSSTVGNSSAAKEMEELPTSRVPFPQMTNPVEPLHDGDLDSQVPASQDTTVLISQETDLGSQLNPLHIKNSKKGLGFIKQIATDAVNEVLRRQQMTEMKKYCPKCLSLVRRSLRRLFLRTWKCRGSGVSLDIADEVIGTCTSAVYLEFLNNDSKGLSHGVNSSCRTGCVCRVCGRRAKIVVKLSSSKNKGSKSSELVCMQDENSLKDPTYACLCSLVKIITELQF